MAKKAKRAYTKEEKKLAAKLNDETLSDEWKDEQIRREAAKVRAEWSESREHTAAGKPNQIVEITEIASKDVFVSKPGRAEY